MADSRNSLEEFGVTSNQETIYTGWYNQILSSGLTGDLIWQAGSQLSTGPSPNERPVKKYILRYETIREIFHRTA